MNRARLRAEATLCDDRAVASGADVDELARQLAEVTRSDGTQYATFRVRGHTFGYYWPRTETVGLKQLVAEQLALIAERPDTFEAQFTVGRFGWVVVQLARVDRAELAELVYEAWRLTAPDELLDPDAEIRLPH